MNVGICDFICQDCTEPFFLNVDNAGFITCPKCGSESIRVVAGSGESDYDETEEADEEQETESIEDTEDSEEEA